MACALMPTNYFVVVVLPSRKIKRVARLTACNYERCVMVTIFSPLDLALARVIVKFIQTHTGHSMSIQQVFSTHPLRLF